MSISMQKGRSFGLAACCRFRIRNGGGVCALFVVPLFPMLPSFNVETTSIDTRPCLSSVAMGVAMVLLVLSPKR
jgi:hypothetical protein